MKGSARQRSEGERILTAVERLVDDCNTLIGRVEAIKASVDVPEQAADYREAVAARIIDAYSTRSAIAGGLSALPATLPGPGTGVALIAGSLVDMTLVLKHEVEMAMCLTHLYGFDLRDERERWLAYVIVGVRTCEAESGRNYFSDLLEAQLDALPLYTPRQMFKIAATVFGRLALRSLAGGWSRALPLVGILVSAATNHVMLTKVGWSCVDTLERRCRALEPEPAVDAVVS
jgi:uncharacterized protein (DUF697 family)